MKLSIENVGILSKIDLEINGITVIAGENDTGKSTISKSLYAMFNGFYKIDEKIENMKIRNLRRDIIEILEREFGVYINTQYLKKDVLSKILLKKDFIDKKDIREIVENTIKNTNLKRKPNSSIDEIAEELEKRINNIKQTKDINIANEILKQNFNKEFSNQINNINTKEMSSISLSIKNKMNIRVKVEREHISFIKTGDMRNIYTRAIYMDNPLILDKINERDFMTFNLFLEDNYFHVDNLIYDLQRKVEENPIDKIQIDKKFNFIFTKIDKEGIGNLTFNTNNLNEILLYESSKNQESLNIKNVSAGLKSFLIIKTLLEKRVLKEKGVLILDEPEIHLHPEWQVLFAELIVLIQKEFNMHILLTTHSPYFLYAIELYSKKYEINGKCKFYFSEKKDEKADLIDVTDDIGIVFKSLSTPFFKLEDMEVKMEEENCEK